MQEVPGIFALMEPLPQAIASFEQLATKFDTYIYPLLPEAIPPPGLTNYCGLNVI
jgi:5'-nucleotidase